MKLTNCEKAMYNRLIEEGTIMWLHVNKFEMQTLNALVEKGCAETYGGKLGKCYERWQVIKGITCE